MRSSNIVLKMVAVLLVSITIGMLLGQQTVLAESKAVAA